MHNSSPENFPLFQPEFKDFTYDPKVMLKLDESGVQLHFTEIDVIVGYANEEFTPTLLSKGQAVRNNLRSISRETYLGAIFLHPNKTKYGDLSYAAFSLSDTFSLIETYDNRLLSLYNDLSLPFEELKLGDDEIDQIAFIKDEIAIATEMRDRLASIIPPKRK